MMSRQAGRRAAVAAMLAASLSLAACSVLPERKAVDIYRLPTSLASVPAPAGGQGTLRVPTPHAGRLLETSRIAVITEGDRVSSYAAARWADNPADLMRDRLAQALRAGGNYADVVTEDSNVRAGFELDTELQAFHGEYRGGQPHARVALRARLVSTRTREVLATRAFEAVEPAAGTGVPAVVEAFGKAADTVARDVAAWAVK